MLFDQAEQLRRGRMAIWKHLADLKHVHPIVSAHSTTHSEGYDLVRKHLARLGSYVWLWVLESSQNRSNAHGKMEIEVQNPVDVQKNMQESKGRR